MIHLARKFARAATQRIQTSRHKLFPRNSVKLSGEKWRISDLKYAQFVGDKGEKAAPSSTKCLTSQLCQQQDFETNAYRYWIEAIKEVPRFHRKQWEFYFIAQSLFERGMLEKGRRGLGFGVGLEPLAALFASLGAQILATDQNLGDAQSAGWAESGQHAHGVNQLNCRNICPNDEFQQRVQFREVDMNDIPMGLDAQFDFCWSACSLEHLGSIKHGLDFIVASLRTLRPGGIAVHTTEFNLTSNSRTLETPSLSIFRRQDIESLVKRVSKEGHRVWPIDWFPGTGVVDGYVDLPPYRDEPHLKLRIAELDCTSIGLIIQRRS